MNTAVASLRSMTERTKYTKGILPLEFEQMNLEKVKEKLIERALYGREKDSPPVPLDRLDDAILDYRRYQFLNLKYHAVPIAPSYDIDEVWHQHILFTREYAADCKTVFGEMRHHVPHFGRGARNLEEDIQILNDTRALWMKEFDYVPKSYDGMTALTSDNGWSGNVDLSTSPRLVTCGR